MLNMFGLAAQVRPDFFPEETTPTNTNFEVYSQKNGVNRRASLANLRKYFGAQIVVSAAPAPTGNPENARNKVIVVLPDSATYFVDWNGNAVLLGAGTGAGGGELSDAYISNDTLYLLTPDSTYTILIPAGADDWGTQVVEKDSTLRGNGTLADPLRVNRDTFATRAEVAQALTDSVAARPTGTGTTNAMAKWLSSTSLGNSLMSDDGARITAGGTAGLVLPAGTTAQRSGAPVAGETRRNTSTGYAESYDGTTWRQADFPTTATTSASLRYNGTNWESSSVLRIHGNGITLGSTGNTTSPLTIKRSDFSTNNLINFNLNGSDAGLLSWDAGSTSSYSVGKNSSGFFQILEGSSNNTGLVYNRETNGVNINNTFANNSTFYVKYRTPDIGGHTTSVYIEGSATGNTFRIESNGNVGIMTGASTPSNTLHVVGTARVTGSSTLPAASVTGRDSLGVFRDVTIGSGLTLSGGTLSATGPAAAQYAHMYVAGSFNDTIGTTSRKINFNQIGSTSGTATSQFDIDTTSIRFLGDGATLEVSATWNGAVGSTGDFVRIYIVKNGTKIASTEVYAFFSGGTIPQTLHMHPAVVSAANNDIFEVRAESVVNTLTYTTYMLNLTAKKL